MKILFALGKVSPTSIPVEWAEGLSRRGHHVKVIPAACADSKENFAKRLLDGIRIMEPEIVHLHHTLPAAFAWFCRSRRRPLGSVLTVHRLMSDMKIPARLAHTAAAWKVDAVVANSEATLRSLPHSLKFLGKRRQRIYNGVDLARITELPRSSAAGDGRIRLISVGRLIEDKGFDLLLAALKLVVQRIPVTIRLDVVGGGTEAGHLQRLADSLGLGATVQFSGEVTRANVYERLADADLFVLASRTEGFCNAVVEAMASGLPVVVTPAGALPEVVGETGWIAEEVSVGAFADALTAALTASSGQRFAAGREAANRARSLFSLDATLDAYEGLYQDLVHTSA